MLLNAIKSPDEKLRGEFLSAMGSDGENHCPWPLPNLKPSTERNFWGWRSSYSFKLEAWTGQHKIDGEWATVLVYFVGHSQFIDGGFAVAYFHQYGKERVAYYEWAACDHQFASKNAGNCLTRYTCKKCGKTYEIDSSG